MVDSQVSIRYLLSFQNLCTFFYFLVLFWSVIWLLSIFHSILSLIQAFSYHFNSLTIFCLRIVFLHYSIFIFYKPIHISFQNLRPELLFLTPSIILQANFHIFPLRLLRILTFYNIILILRLYLTILYIDRYTLYLPLLLSALQILIFFQLIFFIFHQNLFQSFLLL